MGLTIVALMFAGQALPLAVVTAAVRSGRISVGSAAGDGGSYTIWQPTRLPYSLARWLELSFDRGREFCTDTTGFFRARC
jgi:hypothetical protein